MARTPAPAHAPARLPPGLDAAALRAAVLRWYDAEGRTLPFRGVRDPWAILVSEAMAQQTQVARAGETWRTFMAAYPTPAALAAASPSDVLRAWRGLGYNRRAIALRAAAIAIVNEHDGRVPDDLDALRRLPGVGPYTARAVAALAFGRPVGAVDTNVRRVLTRVAPAGTLTPGALQAVADALVDPHRPGAWTHALMDVGARICRPSRPDCPACPIARWCATGRALGEGAEAGDVPRRDGPSRDRSVSEPPTPGRRDRPVRERPVRFPATTRWLRGRLVDRLRDAPDGEWVRLDDPVGEHDAASVSEVVARLEREGLLERHPRDPALARLPTSVPDERAAQ